jgi:hypothetical protein
MVETDMRLLGRLKVFCKREFGESIDLERMRDDLDYAETVLATIEDIDGDLGCELAGQLRQSLGLVKSS